VLLLTEVRKCSLGLFPFVPEDLDKAGKTLTLSFTLKRMKINKLYPAFLLFPARTGTSPESTEVSKEMLHDPLGFGSSRGY